MSRRKYRNIPWFSNVLLGLLAMFLVAFAAGAYRLGDHAIAFWAGSAALACSVILAIINSNLQREED